jgi:hypothetical protein
MVGETSTPGLVYLLCSEHLTTKSLGKGATMPQSQSSYGQSSLLHSSRRDWTDVLPIHHLHLTFYFRLFCDDMSPYFKSN